MFQTRGQFGYDFHIVNGPGTRIANGNHLRGWVGFRGPLSVLYPLSHPALNFFFPHFLSNVSICPTFPLLDFLFRPYHSLRIRFGYILR